MDLNRMLEKCIRDQWSANDLDWSVTPRDMSRDDEMAIVQYFTNMAGIERLAKALFEEQHRRAQNGTLRDIFATFIVDEERHAVVAERLADHYDVHHYRDYVISEELERFRPHFLAVLRYLPNEIANVYITGGELMLDIALLRSLNDYVSDDMSAQAMRLINRDESRHIAIDYYMVEYYASPAYLAQQRALGLPSPVELARGLWTLAAMMYHARPFARAVFFEPMVRVDPTGQRMREAIKRMQLLGLKPNVAKRPFARVMRSVQLAYNTAPGRLLFGNVLSRIAGMPPHALETLYTAQELSWAQRASFDELADDALAAKELH